MIEALSNIPFENLYVGMPVISGNTGSKGKIIRLIPEVDAIRQEDNEIEIAWNHREHTSRNWQFALNSVYYMDDSVSLFEVINKTSKEVPPGRTEADVMLHLVEEVGELALELAIHRGSSYKKAGEDGVIGEAIDSLINALDIIYVHKPDITEEELIAYAVKKCQKWRIKTGGKDLSLD
ncbi:MAG TPA: hypothetical protein VFM18_17545 [Methanosarcina sp.]|nr:hypothetical protein [Methanosarcina sp.]